MKGEPVEQGGGRGGVAGWLPHLLHVRQVPHTFYLFLCPIKDFRQD
jgi:hypothetical protein